MEPEDRERLVRMETKLDMVLAEQKDLRSGVDDWRASKNKFIGWLIGVGISAGAAGASVSKALASIFHGTQH